MPPPDRNGFRKRLYKEKCDADVAATQANNEVTNLEAEQKALKAKEPNKVSPIQEKDIEDKLKAANDKKKEAAKKKNDANEAWNAERDKHEPTKVKSKRRISYNSTCA